MSHETVANQVFSKAVRVERTGWRGRRCGGARGGTTRGETHAARGATCVSEIQHVGHLLTAVIPLSKRTLCALKIGLPPLDQPAATRAHQQARAPTLPSHSRAGRARARARRPAGVSPLDLERTHLQANPNPAQTKSPALVPLPPSVTRRAAVPNREMCDLSPAPPAWLTRCRAARTRGLGAALRATQSGRARGS